MSGHRFCTMCARPLAPYPWWQRGPLVIFAPMPRCTENLDECKRRFQQRIGLLP